MLLLLILPSHDISRKKVYHRDLEAYLSLAMYCTPDTGDKSCARFYPQPLPLEKELIE